MSQEESGRERVVEESHTIPEVRGSNFCCNFLILVLLEGGGNERMEGRGNERMEGRGNERMEG